MGSPPRQAADFFLICASSFLKIQELIEWIAWGSGRQVGWVVPSHLCQCYIRVEG